MHASITIPTGKSEPADANLEEFLQVRTFYCEDCGKVFVFLMSFWWLSWLLGLRDTCPRRAKRGAAHSGERLRCEQGAGARADAAVSHPWPWQWYKIANFAFFFFSHQFVELGFRLILVSWWALWWCRVRKFTGCSVPDGEEFKRCIEAHVCCFFWTAQCTSRRFEVVGSASCRPPLIA